MMNDVKYCNKEILISEYVFGRGIILGRERSIKFGILRARENDTSNDLGRLYEDWVIKELSE